jgi:hypothetical protein
MITSLRKRHLKLVESLLTDYNTAQKGNKALCAATPNKQGAGQTCILIT